MQEVKKSISIILSLVLSIIMVAGTTQVNAQDSKTYEEKVPTILERGESKIEDSLYNALYKYLENGAKNIFPAKTYYIGSVNREGDWALISLSKLNKNVNIKSAGTYLGESILILAHTNDDGQTWELEIEGDVKYIDKIKRTPDNFLTTDAKKALSADGLEPRLKSTDIESLSTLSATSASIYKFPWPELNTRKYTKGWHGTTTGLDLGSSSTNRIILASGAGTVTAVSACSSSVNVTVKHPDGKIFKYLHLDKNTFDAGKIKNGVSLTQGKRLGTLKAGNFSDNCGYAVQKADYSHIHWGLPTNVSNTIDLWTITYPGNCWSKPGYSNRCVGSSFGSTNKEVV